MYKICRTEESLRRQRELEAGLLQAMETQPYGKITISDLCRRMGIPRKTFYRYFPTREDALLSLIDHKLADCNDAVFRDWNGNRHFEFENLERFFSYWHRETVFLDAVRDNDLRYLLLERTSVIVDTMKAGAPPAAFARDQVEYFVAYGLMSTVLRWHHHGFPSSAEEMALTFAQLLKSTEVSITGLLL